MKCLLIYDIPDDRARTKIADFCLDYGLDRVQYSAFVGDLSMNHQEELMLKITKRLGKAAGRIDIFAIRNQDWQCRQSLNQKMPPLGPAWADPSLDEPALDKTEETHHELA